MTQANTTVVRVYDIVRRQAQEQSECKKHYTWKHRSSRSGRHAAEANTRAAKVQDVLHRQTPQQSECKKHCTGKHKSSQIARHVTQANTKRRQSVCNVTQADTRGMILQDTHTHHTHDAE